MEQGKTSNHRYTDSGQRRQENEPPGENLGKGSEHLDWMFLQSPGNYKGREVLADICLTERMGK